MRRVYYYRMDIGHIWFDFSDTLASMERAEFEKMIYGAYAKATGKEITPELIADYKALLKEKKSNSAVFTSLGLPSDYLSNAAADRTGMYHLTDIKIPVVLQELKDIIPVSVFSNTRLDVVLPSLGISPEWFTNILGPDIVKEPKPAPAGFLKMIELSKMPAERILYIGDDVEKDIMPAKAVGLRTGLLWKESDVPDYCFKDFTAVLALFS